MKAGISLIAVGVLLASTAFAQDAYSVAPQAYRKQFENDLVRVTRVHYAPHEQLKEHSHPARPTIYVYLKDGGPVLFKHEHGESGAMAATRPATQAGAYRIALGRNETHVVDNQSDLPSDFLQVELKTEIDPKTFNGRRFRDPATANLNSTTVEFDTPQIRIVRVHCIAPAACTSAAAALTNAALQVATGTGDTAWVRPHSADGAWSAGEYLLVEFKSGIAKADRRRHHEGADMKIDCTDAGRRLFEQYWPAQVTNVSSRMPAAATNRVDVFLAADIR